MNDLGRYRKTYVRLWRHPGFVELTDAEKTLTLYLLTGPQSNRIGLFVLSPATAAEDLGTVPETLTKRLARICQTFGWLFDKGSRVMWIPSWFRFNVPENPNVLKGSLRDLNEIPPCGLVDAFGANIETLPENLRETFLKGLVQRLPKRSRNQDQDQDPKPKQEPSARSAVAEKKNEDEDNLPTPDTGLLSIAAEVLNDEPRNVDTNYLIDALLERTRRRDMKVNRQTAIHALATAQRVSGVSA